MKLERPKKTGDKRIPKGSKDLVRSKTEDFPTVTGAEFQKLLDTDTGRDTFIEFSGFISNTRGEKPISVSYYLNHTDYPELGPELRNFCIALSGRDGSTPVDFETYSLSLIINRGLNPLESVTRDEATTAIGPREANLTRDLNKIETLRLPSFTFNDDLTGNEKMAARMLLQRLTRELLAEITKRRAVPVQLDVFCEDFFRRGAILTELKEAKIAKIFYPASSPATSSLDLTDMWIDPEKVKIPNNRDYYPDLNRFFGAVRAISEFADYAQRLDMAIPRSRKRAIEYAKNHVGTMNKWHSLKTDLESKLMKLGFLSKDEMKYDDYGAFPREKVEAAIEAFSVWADQLQTELESHQSLIPSMRSEQWRDIIEEYKRKETKKLE